jgi:hypothetical protein
MGQDNEKLEGINFQNNGAGTHRYCYVNGINDILSAANLVDCVISMG